METAALARCVKEKGLELGLGAIGFAAIVPSRHADFLNGWLAGGRAGEMEWMERTARTSTDLRRRFPWARTAVAAAVPYLPYKEDRPEGVVRDRLRLPVPGADLLADIATEHPVSDVRPLPGRDAAADLDRQVRDAARRIDQVRLRDRPRRAGVETGGARAAAVGHRIVGREIEIGQHLAEEQPGVAARVDQVGVLPEPAETGARRQLALQDRHGVGVDARPRTGRLRLDEAGQPLEPGGQHDVVVAADGVTRHVGDQT